MKKVMIDVKTQQPNVANFPTLSSFPQGVPGDVEESFVHVGRHIMKNSKTAQTMVALEVGGLRCMGNDVGEHSTKNDSCAFAVGVYNSETKKMKIVPASHVYVLKPAAIKPNGAADSNMTNVEKRQSLTEEFGSRKKKRALQAAQSNVISAENISGAAEMEKILLRGSGSQVGGSGGSDSSNGRPDEASLQLAVKAANQANKKASNKRK